MENIFFGTCSKGIGVYFDWDIAFHKLVQAKQGHKVIYNLVMCKACAHNVAHAWILVSCKPAAPTYIVV